MAGDHGCSCRSVPELRRRPQISLFRCRKHQVQRRDRLAWWRSAQGALAVAQLDAERDLQLLHAAATAASAAPAAASAASAASAGDADVSGWLGDPGNGSVSGAAAAAATAATGARARLLRVSTQVETGPGNSPGPVFFCARRKSGCRSAGAEPW